MDYASRDSMQLLAVGLISIAAISLGAATVESTVQEASVTGTDANPIIPSGEESGSLNTSDMEGNGSVNMDPGDSSGGIVANIQTCIEPLSAWYGTAVYFGAFLGVIYLIKRAYSFGAAILGMYAVAPVAFTAYFLATARCVSVSTGGPGNNGVADQIANVAGSSLLSPDVSPVLIAAVFGVALVAVAAVLYRSSGDQTVTTLGEEEEAAGEQPDVADLAAAAGEAAERLQEHDADVDNEVYRAWWEMTSLLNVPKPDSATPGEFAEAAIEAGLDESHVDDLTTLFEEVRYGRRDPESREQRAIEVFQDIEAQYGDTGGADDGR